MKKEKMITRTMTTTTFTVIGIRDGAIVKEPSDKIIGKLDEKDALEYARKFLAVDGLLVAGVEGVTYTETLYGVPESDFLKIAVVLPPRTKADENDD